MGRIEDKHKERGNTDKDGNPLNDGFGKIRRDHEDFEIDEDTIKDHEDRE